MVVVAWRAFCSVRGWNGCQGGGAGAAPKYTASGSEIIDRAHDNSRHFVTMFCRGLRYGRAGFEIGSEPERKDQGR